MAERIEQALERARQEEDRPAEDQSRPAQTPEEAPAPDRPLGRVIEVPPAPVPPPPPPPTEGGDGTLPFVEGGFDPTYVSANETASLIVEQYRAIRTNMLASPDHRRPFISVLTSSARKEGKTVSTLNLGLSLAELGEYRVLCVDADARGPSMATMLELDPTPGVLGVLRGECALDEVIQKSPVRNFDVITCPTLTHVNPTPAYSGAEARDLIEEFRVRYDYVLIDTPPIIDFTDAGLLGAITDGAYLVVQLYRTPRQVVRRAVSLLRAAQVRVLGSILTNLQMFVPKYLYRYDYELYRYQYQ